MFRMMLLMGAALFLLSACGDDHKVRIISGIENGSVTVDDEAQGFIRVGYTTVYLSSGDYEVSVELLSTDGEWLYKGESDFSVNTGATTIVELDIQKLTTEKRKTRLEKEAKAQAKALASIQSNIVTIPAGSFSMGSNAGRSDEKPIHRVKISSFQMGKYEVTQAQWKAVMGNNPSHFSGANNPVDQVSGDGIQGFIKKMNQQSGKHFRLPSEAEWEYAARAGSRSKYSWGNNIGKNKANCAGCGSKWDGSKTAPVGSFRPNAFGLYDMHGNVWEWVQDCWNGSYNGAPGNGSAWLTGTCAKRVLRGGSWLNNPFNMRSAYRGWDDTDDRNFDNGFRLVQD